MGSFCFHSKIPIFLALLPKAIMAVCEYCQFRSLSQGNVATRLNHITGVFDIFFLFVCSLEFPIWQTHSLATVSSVTIKISWMVGWLWLSYVCTFISIHISAIDSINWYMNHKDTNVHIIGVGILCLEIWILVWKSHGKVMELFSEIFVGTLSH